MQHANVFRHPRVQRTITRLSLINQSRKYDQQRHVVQITLKHPVTRHARMMNSSAHLVRVA
jgi:hypothetical protein